MKTLFTYVAFLALSLLGVLACRNQDRVFPGFDYTTTYFPYQYPIRTLVLGDYYFDNSRDNQLKFLISATLGGVRENIKNQTVEFVVDDSLTNRLYIGDKRILPLPRNYYTLSNPSQINIPKGQLTGNVEVQLTNDFLNDKAAVGHLGTTYVIPIRIVKSTTDSILVGRSGIANPDVRVATNWVLRPKNYTLFGINYVNQYHGKYLMRGASQVMTGTTLVETNVYRNQYIERDQVVDINTASRNTVVYSNRIVRSTSSPGNFEMLITFNENGSGTIINTTTGKFPVKGTAKFVKNAETWGGEKRHTIYLDYQINYILIRTLNQF